MSARNSSFMYRPSQPSHARWGAFKKILPPRTGKAASHFWQTCALSRWTSLTFRAFQNSRPPDKSLWKRSGLHRFWIMALHSAELRGVLLRQYSA